MVDNTFKIIKHKVALLNLADELGNVSRAYKLTGLSRDTFYLKRSSKYTVDSVIKGGSIDEEVNSTYHLRTGIA
ncbi:ISSod13, transposase [Legionella erythra]|uniref:ISSod13, transposase n=1 Tax=Legionella erythra TaxID=448 RepID=A0A0W0TFS3_LEGER|nr:ISSod13, transposase [Legionella erythra]